MKTNVIENGHYCRSNHSKVIELATTLSSQYKTPTINPHTIIATSGMNAISIVFHTLLSQYTNFVHGSELYCDTERLFDSPLITKKASYEIDVIATDAIITLFSTTIANEHNVLFIESCSNPSGHIFDFRIIPQLRTLSKSLMVIVDNTWLTEEILNPFDYGTDIVILSLTKYYSASTVIMGACLFADQHIYELCHIYKCITGIHVSPNDASEIIAKLPEMRQRISSSSQLTLDTIAALTSKTTLPISHPSLPSHISYDLANLFFKCNDSGMRLYPSIFTFLLNMSKNRAIKFMKSGQLDYATSYGAAMSRFDPYPTVNNGVTTCRLSIGYGDTLENIMHAFQQFVQP